MAVVHAVGDRPNPVLVAQSLGAFTAPLVCVRLPVQMLILLNPMVPNPNETPGEWWANTGHREAKRAKDRREGRPPGAEVDWRVDFFHDVPPAVIAAASAHDAAAVWDGLRVGLRLRRLAGRANQGAGCPR